jgi:hypothetical protein
MGVLRTDRGILSDASTDRLAPKGAARPLSSVAAVVERTVGRGRYIRGGFPRTAPMGSAELASRASARTQSASAARAAPEPRATRGAHIWSCVKFPVA